MACNDDDGSYSRVACNDDDGSYNRAPRCVLTEPALARYALQMYADSYTLSGCSDAALCGVFRRVAAHCTDQAFGRCPGGISARVGWTDATLCDGAPVYQREGGAVGGAVLFQQMAGFGSSYWWVEESSALGNCLAQQQLYSSSNSGRVSPMPPDAAIYGWSDPGGYDSGRGHDNIHIVAGDGGGGGR